MTQPQTLENRPSEAELIARFHHGDLASVALHAQAFLAAPLRAAEIESATIVAVASAMTGNESIAAQLFEALVKAAPTNPSHRMNLAVLKLQVGATPEARALLEQCHRERPADAEILFNLGLARFALADFAEARIALASVVRGFPDHATARLYLARCTSELGDVSGALALIDGCDFSNISTIRERYELASLYSATDQSEHAEQTLRTLLAEAPGELHARVNLAGLLERANRIGEAQAQLDQIDDLAFRQSAAWLTAQAKLRAAEKQWATALEGFDQALEAARSELNGPPLLKLESDIEFGRGHALDKLKRFDDAHSSLVRANTLIRDHFRHYNPARTDEGRIIAGLTDTPELDHFVRITADEVMLASEDTPIFLVGFPRSGTTLLDQILDSHPALQVLEEKPAIDTVANATARLPGGYPQALAQLSLVDAANLRRLYWQTVSKYLTRTPGTRLVDKYPLNLARVHLIMRLFPKAKWIFAIRHPCDVVLSCFMQNFRFTESTHGFWSIDQTASIYEQVMNLWLKQRERLKPDTLDLRYEDLITDFESNARRLIDFLGLPWDPAVLRYNEHAKTRRINTPSYNQVVEPIYKTAAGRWKNYEAYFGEALPMLNPFIETLGYKE